MADTRTLKLSLLADVNKFVSGMNDADNSTKTLNEKIGGYSKKMAKAFLGVTIAVGTMAIAIGVDAVKAAAEDEVSQKKFQETLKDTAGVIDKTVVASINDWIQKMQFATGYSDGDLRDALGRLTRSTGSVSTAQDILQVAMDTSRGTGKDLASVTDILAKAYDGNYTPLKKMGVKLDENTVSSKDFNGVLLTLTDLFGGQASTYADTFQGKLDIVNQRFGELKESAGAPLIGVLGTLLEQVGYVAKALGGEDPESLSNRARELAGVYDGKGAGGYNLGLSLANLGDSFKTLFEALNGDKADGASSTLQTFADALNSVAGAINSVAGAYKKARDIGGNIMDFITISPGEGPKFADSALGKALQYNKRALGGPVSNTNSYLVGENGPELFTPNVGGKITSNGGSGGTTIILNGIVDAESARRSIEQLIQRSARRTGAIDWVGATL
jgi:hypothetical protein